MNIYVNKRSEIKTSLSVEDTRQRLRELISGESTLLEKIGIVYTGIDVNPLYKGHIGIKNFCISPVFQGKNPTSFYSIDGTIEETNGSAFLDVRMEVDEIVQKLTIVVFIAFGILIAILLAGKQSMDIVYVMISFVCGFYLFFSLAAYLGYRSSKKRLERILS